MRDTHISDYYVTPIIVVVDFLHHLVKQEPNILENKNVLDPCAGGKIDGLDGFDEMSYPIALGNYNVANITTFDIRTDSKAQQKNDYLDTLVQENKYDIIISNPPFNIALEIIQKAIRDVAVNGYVIMLQRINFLGSNKRKTFWENNMPKYIFVHAKRLSFTPDKKTDSIEYAHFVWQKDWQGETILKLI